MTNNQLTREWLQGRIANMECYGVVGDEALILQVYRIALAAMDSEPVAEVYQPQNAGICAPLGPSIRMLCPLEPGTNLYRHAQPVVPDGLVKAVEFYEKVKRENPPVETGAWKDAVDWVLTEACRAAMLSGGNDE
ncbi:TPA: hypothetical protein RFT37_003147 [Klebsiella pneumoniae subsp. pneumoniae]|uniref:hypothetical protein n=1 Tax=Klebsiella pneumoniae TaxID=573 RepID=UPI000D750AFC|nr:hypothetical protein [Klebsiella pneumoniae]HDS4004324.1 hypothetical protein [Klebsiella pneumoniae subsp. pneumoniae]MBD1316286.1 hypothetical protein [Klebsiella pneumoniae]MBZ6597637.1 hypothetical protein [Klebsiella pneumoniae]MCX0289412.1 hypothetical protein [Klebsiella pneumoniae]MDN0159165.1 hypothetical protein [Klebsiella pneumoniae]